MWALRYSLPAGGTIAAWTSSVCPWEALPSNRRRRKLSLTTKTELNAIATPAEAEAAIASAIGC